MDNQLEDKNIETGQEMSFWGHLEVLRWSLVRIAAVVVVLMVGFFIAMPHIFDAFVLGPP